MNKNILLTMLMITLLAVNVSALDTIKPAQINEEYTILQTCFTCSEVNISISNINGLIISNVGMTDNGSGVWTYDFTPDTIGRHDVTGVGDIDGTDTGFAYYFTVSSSGLTGTLGFYFIILLVSVGIIIIGFSMNDPWIVILGGFALIFVGLFTMFYGIDGMRNTVYTWGLGIIILMLGCYFSIRSAAETMFG